MEEIAKSGNTILMPGQAARILGVTTKTLAGMTALHPIILPSGHRRYNSRDVFTLATPTTRSTDAPPCPVERVLSSSGLDPELDQPNRSTP